MPKLPNSRTGQRYTKVISRFCLKTADTFRDHINSDDPGAYWSPNGPMPVSNSTNNTVAENGQTHRWKVITDDSYKKWADYSDDKDQVGMIWSDSTGAAIPYYDKQGKYIAWRYQVLDELGGDRHTPARDYPGMQPQNDGYIYRQWLRVHADQGQLGSQGCIAGRGNFDSIWFRLHAIGQATAASGHGYYIPLAVYDSAGATVDPVDPSGVNVWGSSTVD